MTKIKDQVVSLVFLKALNLDNSLGTKGVDSYAIKRESDIFLKSGSPVKTDDQPEMGRTLKRVLLENTSIPLDSTRASQAGIQFRSSKTLTRDIGI